MAPIEVEFRGSWSRDQEDFTLKPGHHKHVRRDDLWFVVSCDEKDHWGKISTKDPSTGFGGFEREVGRWVFTGDGDVVKLLLESHCFFKRRATVMRNPVGINVNGEKVVLVTHWEDKEL